MNRGIRKHFNSVRATGKAISFSCAVVFLLSLIHFGLLAQVKRPAPVLSQRQKAGSPSKALTYSNSELDRAINQLSGNFKGNDIALVSRQLLESQGQSEKSEFETQEEWQRRLVTLWSKPIVGKMTVHST